MYIHAPGPLSLVCLLIRPRPGTYCHSPLLCRFGFILLWRCSVLGLQAGKPLVLCVGFVPSSPQSDRSDMHTPDPPSAYSSLGSRLPAVFAFSPPLWLTQLVLRVSFLPLSPGFVPGPRSPLAPSGHARDPEFHTLPFRLGANFGMMCGGLVGLV